MTVPNGSVGDNHKVWREFKLAPIATSAIRVTVRGALSGYSRITELEAYVAP